MYNHLLVLGPDAGSRQPCNSYNNNNNKNLRLNLHQPWQLKQNSDHHQLLSLSPALRCCVTLMMTPSTVLWQPLDCCNSSCHQIPADHTPLGQTCKRDPNAGQMLPYVVWKVTKHNLFPLKRSQKPLHTTPHHSHTLRTTSHHTISHNSTQPSTTPNHITPTPDYSTLQCNTTPI